MQFNDRVGYRMKLQDLHVLLTVVQAGSMGKAAERLNTVQPAVSRSIADLERALGVRLLDRHRHGVEPTAYGRALLDCGVAVFDELRQGVKNVEALADPETGEVRIGSNHLLAPSVVTAVVDRLAQRYPRIVFHLEVGDSQELRRQLHQRTVDLLVAWQFGPLADDQLALETLFDDSYLVVAGADNPLTRRRKIALADLMHEPWVLPPAESFIGSIVGKGFNARNLDYPHASVVGFPPGVRSSLLRTGRFLTVFPTSTLRLPTPRSDLKALPIGRPLGRVPVGILSLRNRTLSPAAQLFIDAARELAKTMDRKGSRTR